MGKKVIGYTAGVYDMFHIGHLNLLKNAKKHCDYLIVGVNSDEATFSYKNKFPVIPWEERAEIVEAIKYVDEIVKVDNTDKIFAFEKTLKNRGINVTIRREQGHDIDAACGQLRAKERKEETR